MRVMQLCLTGGHGGLELYVSRLCKLLPQRRHDCVAVVDPGSMLAEKLSEQGIPLVEMTVSVRELPLLQAVRLARLLVRERIDVLHVHWTKDLPLAVLAKRLCSRSVKLIHSRHMSITRPKQDSYHRLLYRSLDKVIVLSAGMYEEARRYLPVASPALEMLYPGVPKPEAVTASRSNGSGSVALFGRIEPAKGQHLLIEAADLLRRAGIVVNMHIIGHATDEGYLRDLKQDVSRRKLQNQVVFSGFHPNPQAIMPNFDIIVLASKRETFGLVLAEAMRCGVAVVGSNAGGVPEIVEHDASGLLFEPDSAISLAEQLRALVQDEALRRRLAVAGRDRADRLFSEEQHVARLERIMLDLPT